MKQHAGLNALKVLMILFVIFIHENPAWPIGIYLNKYNAILK